MLVVACRHTVNGGRYLIVIAIFDRTFYFREILENHRLYFLQMDLNIEVEHLKYIGTKYTTNGLLETHNRNCLCTVSFNNFKNDLEKIKTTISNEARLENGNLRTIAKRWLEAMNGTLSYVNPDNFANVFLVLNNLGIVQLINEKKMQELANRDKLYDEIVLSDSHLSEEQKKSFEMQQQRYSILKEKDPDFPIEITWGNQVRKSIVNLICTYQPHQDLPQAFNIASFVLNGVVSIFAAYAFHQKIIIPTLLILFYLLVIN